MPVTASVVPSAPIFCISLWIIKFDLSRFDAGIKLQ